MACGEVIALWRFAVKGLDRDVLDAVTLQPADGFPSDRRWALQYAATVPEAGVEAERAPVWLHKANFFCAFTAGELCGAYVTDYDDATDELVVFKRSASAPAFTPAESTAADTAVVTAVNSWHRTGGSEGDGRHGFRAREGPCLLRARLTDPAGRAAAERFFSAAAGKPLKLQGAEGQPFPAETAEGHAKDPSAAARVHHYGNTAAGSAIGNGDARVIHIVNAATVEALSTAARVPLHPSRFRPNIVVSGIPAWEEFGWVGKRVQIGGATFKVLKRTVRCDATKIDPRFGTGKTDYDVPGLLQQYFPEHGPYLGVYAQVVSGGKRHRPLR